MDEKEERDIVANIMKEATETADKLQQRLKEIEKELHEFTNMMGFYAARVKSVEVDVRLRAMVHTLQREEDRLFTFRDGLDTEMMHFRHELCNLFFGTEEKKEEKKEEEKKEE